MHSQRQHQRSDLVRIATHVMAERGLEPEFSRRVEQQLAAITGPGRDDGPDVHDLTHLLWCSIDNDDSLDLDQLTVCEPLPSGAIRLWVAIADVDALVKKDTPIDAHALLNTTSVYTSARIFPMLPDRLCTDLTSLNPAQDRLALVTEMVFNADASLAGSTVYRARVHNRAKLAYDAVSAWIDGEADLPDAAAAVPGMEAQLRTQDALAQQLRARRHALGSLDLETFQPRALFEGEQVVDIRQQVQNRARQLIEEVMIATNGCTARYLAAQGGASLRRVVRSPERWLRIVGVAKDYGETCRTSRTRRRWRPSWPGSTGSTRCAFPTSPGHRQAHGPWRIRGRDARRRAHRPFRTGGARLHPLHRAQPPFPGPDHLAPAQGRAGG
jgi:exoribonuclease-2